MTPDGTGDAPTIQAAVDSALAWDEIVLESGIYSGTGNRDVVFRIDTVAVRSSSGDPADCVIDCELAGRGFMLPSEIRGITIEGVTIRNGSASDGGGAIRCTRADVEVNNCIFDTNYEYAVYLDLSIADFTDCRFVDNRRFLRALESVAEFTDCVFFHNYGLASLSYYAAAGFTRCTIYGNGGYFGMYYGSNIGCTSCTIWGNNSGTALFWFETIQYFDSRLNLDNCVIANSYSGRVVAVYEGEVETYITCTDIYGNAGGDWVGRIAEHLGQDGNFSACPSFCGADVGDFNLCDGSPCLPGNHPNGYDCGLIGAWGVGCSCGPSRVESATWGGIKAMYK